MLCSDTVPKQLGDEPGEITITWLLSSTILHYCFILNGIFSGEDFTTLLTSVVVDD